MWLDHVFRTQGSVPTILSMGLEMRTECERCHTPLGWESKALLCSHECTFCVAWRAAMECACPNCGGELVARPRRVAAAVAA